MYKLTSEKCCYVILCAFGHQNFYILMFEPHIVETDLKSKMEELFRYRFFYEILDENEDAALFEQLYALQTAIYHLDAHLEAHWKTDQKNLDFHWDNIKTNLIKFGVQDSELPSYLNHIAKYQQHEMDIRKGLLPTRLEMEYFYFYKSCDVKLLRRLIYETRLKGSKSFGSLSDWRYFDLVTEVNDDVADIFEDLSFINGNRFILTMGLMGKDEAKRVFIEFLQDIQQTIKKKLSLTKNPFLHQLHKLTLQHIHETILLIQKNTEAMDQQTLAGAKLFQYLKMEKA